MCWALVGCDGGSRPIGGGLADLAVVDAAARVDAAGAPPDLGSSDLAWRWSLGAGANGLGAGVARGGPFTLQASVGSPGPRLQASGGQFKIEPLLPGP